MAGVLYSLVALGFVLIFKASGVFNFAQGAMVLFAALAVARLSERMPLWVAIVLAVAIMIALAMVIERLVLRPLVNQEPRCAADGDARRDLLSRRFRPDRLGQRHLQDRPRHRARAGDDPGQRLPGRHPGQPRRRRRRDRRGRSWSARSPLFFQKTATGRALRAVADDHQAAQSIGIPLEPHLGHRLVGGGRGRDRRRRDLGRQARRAVLDLAGGAEGAAGGHPRRLHLGARRDRRRPDHRRRREDGRSVPRAAAREGCSTSPAAASRTGSPTCWRCCSCSCGPRACSASGTSTESERSPVTHHGSCNDLPRKRPVQVDLPRRSADAADPAGPRLHDRARRLSRSWSCRSWRATTSSCRS